MEDKMTDAIGEMLERNAKQDGKQVPDTQNKQIEDLQAEVKRLQSSIQGIAASSSKIVSREVDDAVSDIESKLKENVFLSIGVAAFVGFVWGKIRG
jgi:ElaB/YqjD/DUF883 family membrane-anchored ribosome-binding protein